MMSDFRSKKMALMFKFWDMDGDGRITAQDFEQMTVNFGHVYGVSPGSSEYETMHSYYTGMWSGFSSMDSDADGVVGLQEYLAATEAWLANRDAFMANMAGMVDAFFAVIDRNADGTISEREFEMNYRIHGLDESRARLAFGHLDVDGRGGVSRDQMVAYSEELYYSEDPQAPGNWMVLALED